MSNLAIPLQKIGQMIILRRLICRQLSTSGRIGSEKLYFSLENLNLSTLNDIMHKKAEPQSEAETDSVITFKLYMNYD